MTKTIKYNDELEKILTALFGLIGMVAIMINLHLKGYGIENWLDAIKDIASLVVVIAVFLVANNIFKKLKVQKEDFNSIFENYITTWAADNKDLIDASKMFESQSSINDTRILYMILDLSKFGEKPAEAYNSRSKGAFLYLPSKDISEKKEKIYFKINQQLFSKSSNYENEKRDILDKIAIRINERFRESLKVTAKVILSEEKVEVDFSKMDQTKETALRLKDLVEYVKTIILALA